MGASVGSEDRSSPSAVSGQVEDESEPYVRLATLRELHQVLATVNTARSLEDTLQAIADGLVENLGYGLAGVHLVRPDGDVVVAAMAGGDAGDAPAPSRGAFRETWNQRLQAGEDWGGLRFVPYDEGRSFTVGDLAQYGDEPLPSDPEAWHPGDRLFAPLHLTEDGASGELIGVLSVDRPRNGRRPGRGAGRHCRCTPPRRLSRSSMPGCAPTSSAPTPGSKENNRPCAPTRRSSSRSWSTRPRVRPSP